MEKGSVSKLVIDAPSVDDIFFISFKLRIRRMKESE